jgi:hypothetical protein
MDGWRYRWTNCLIQIRISIPWCSCILEVRIIADGHMLDVTRMAYCIPWICETCEFLNYFQWCVFFVCFILVICFIFNLLPVMVICFILALLYVHRSSLSLSTIFDFLPPPVHVLFDWGIYCEPFLRFCLPSPWPYG